MDKGFVIVTIHYDSYLLPISKVKEFVEVMSLTKQIDKIHHDEGNSHHYECSDRPCNYYIKQLDAEVREKKEK